jgi:chaperonin GroES
MINFKPTYNKVIVEVDREVEKIGLIFVPPTAAHERKNQLATVIAVGPGRVIENTGVTVPCCANPGDRVMITLYSGAPIKINNKDYTVIPDQDIIGIIDGEKEIPDVEK